MTQKLQNKLGYGVHLVNPDAFSQAVINHFFSPLNKSVDWQNILHEARVALFEQDLKLGDTIPETTGRYWWRVAEAVGKLLWEDYGITNMFVRHNRPFVQNEGTEDDPETAAIYLEKQRCEPDPVAEVQTKEWFEHYIGLAEGVLLDNEDAEQGQRDLAVFELWVNGYSPKEIAEKPEIAWLKTRKTVDAALRRIVGRLWDYFGVNPENHAMVIGYAGNKARTTTGKSPKENFTKWYSDPANRERHREKCRERMRRKRAEATKVKV